MFLWPDSVKVDNYFILPDSQYSLNYALLVVDIFISKEFIQDKWWTINRNSEEEERFVTELMTILSEFKAVDSNHFIFSFLICYFFFFHFYFWGLSVRVNMTSLSQRHISVTWQGHCYTVTYHMEKHRRFWKDDVIQYV